MKSKTLRTDKKEYTQEYGGEPVVESRFSRQLETELADANFVIKKQNENHQRYCMDADAKISQLETELAEARAEIERKNALIEQMRVALAWLYQWTKNEVEHFGAAAPDDEIIKDVEAALSAAERSD